MTPFNRQEVKQTALQNLAESESNHKKLVLIHTGAILLLTFVLMIVDFLLSQKISTTGGLGSISTRTTLTTIQTGLRFAQFLVIPFWQVGYTFMTLQLAKKEPVSFKTLVEGFLRFGPVLRLFLLQLVLYVGLSIICINVTTMFMSTTAASSMVEALEAINQNTELTSDALLLAYGDALTPLILLFTAIYLTAYAVVNYIYRLAMFSLLDDEKTGAFAAMRNSRILTRGHRMQLFKLDLSFWWFYVLEVLVSMLAMLDLLLAIMGITLPIPEAAVTFIVFALYAAAQLALYYWRKNEVNVTYAQVYTTLMETE